MRLLSISSQVVGGHVGNAALAYPLARQGVALLAVPTVLFSNHPGHGSFTGSPLPAAEVSALIGGLERAGFLAGLDGLMTGYFGTAETAVAAARAVARLSGPHCPYLLDPVLGDGDRLYVAPGIEAAMRERLLPRAHAVTPNPFELARLSGLPAGSAAEQLAAARALLASGPALVLVTSAAVGTGRSGCLLVTAEGAWRLTTPAIAFPAPPNGAGDLLAGLLLAELCRDEPPPAAARAALVQLYGLLQATAATGGRELAVLGSGEAQPDPGAVSLEAVS